jgi:hypothetical protein
MNLLTNKLILSAHLIQILLSKSYHLVRPYRNLPIHFHQENMIDANTVALKKQQFIVNLPDFIRGPPPSQINTMGKLPPRCSRCKYFIPYKKSSSFDEPDIYDAGYGLCKMFGNKTDLIKYSFAKHCRENTSQCGPEGFMYEEMDTIDHLSRFVEEIQLELEIQSYNKVEQETKEEKEETQEEKVKTWTRENENKTESLKDKNKELYEYSKFLSFRNDHLSEK